MDNEKEGFKRIRGKNFFEILNSCGGLKTSEQEKMGRVKEFVSFKGDAFAQSQGIMIPLYFDVKAANKLVLKSFIESHMKGFYELYIKEGSTESEIDFKLHEEEKDDKTALKQAKTICKMAKKMYAKEIKEVKKEFKKEMKELGQENC